MKKKVMIFTTSGGGGHISVTQALQGYLQDDFLVESVLIFQDVLSSIDIIRAVTFGRLNGEDIYNNLVRKKRFGLLNIFYQIAVRYYQSQYQKIRYALHGYLAQNKPDCVISVTPLVNNIILDVCEDLAIPFILLPTDLDIHTFIYNISKPTYNDFYLFLPFDDLGIKKPAQKAQIPDSQIKISGFALRSDFLKEDHPQEIKKRYGIDQDIPIIMILMGAQGSENIITMLKELLLLEQPIHIITCVGKNIDLQKKINALMLPEGICLTVVTFGCNIADLMSIADILITKSGTVSVCEAIYKELPMILDATSAVLKWEQFNHHFIQEHRFGVSLTKLSELPEQVDDFLRHNRFKRYKENLASFANKNPAETIPELLKSIIE